MYKNVHVQKCIHVLCTLYMYMFKNVHVQKCIHVLLSSHSHHDEELSSGLRPVKLCSDYINKIK